MQRTITIIEDDLQFRKSLSLTIQQSRHYSLQGAYENCEEALGFLARRQSWLTILDLALPGISGAAAVRAVKSANPEGEILIHSIHDSGDEVFSALQAGACGYLLKGCPSVDLIEALSQIARGGAPMSFSIARKVAGFFSRLQHIEHADNTGLLSAREQGILEKLSEGYTYKEIAQIMGIAVGTVHSHIKNIYRKLEVNSRAQAVFRARITGVHGNTKRNDALLDE